MTKYWKKFTIRKKIKFFLNQKFCLSLGLREGNPSYRNSLQPPKEIIYHFKIIHFLTFFFFCGHFCPPGSKYSRPKSMRILADPDPQHWLYPIIKNILFIPSNGFSCFHSFVAAYIYYCSVHYIVLWRELNWVRTPQCDANKSAKSSWYIFTRQRWSSTTFSLSLA
jgi:hypothetical protein